MPARSQLQLPDSMATTHSDFADYCCELLATAGPCASKRMFGGFGISTDGLTLAIIADLGEGEKLWLKANATTRALFEAAGCQRFTYTSHSKGESVQRGMDYYSAPEEAMDAPTAMAPWARLALQAALEARASRAVPRKRSGTAKTKAPAKPRTLRAPRP